MNQDTDYACFKKKKSLSLKTILFVFAFHGLFLGLACFSSQNTPLLPKKNNQKLVVQTISLKPTSVVVAMQAEIEMEIETETKTETEVLIAAVFEPVKNSDIIPVNAPEKKKVEIKKIERAKRLDPVKKVEPKKVDVKKVEPKKIEPKKTDVKKAETKKADVKKADVKKADVKKADVKKADVKKADVKKTEAQKKPLEKKPAQKEPLRKDVEYIPKDQTPKPKALNEKQKELLQEAAKNLAKMDQSKATTPAKSKLTKSEIAPVKLIGNLSVDAMVSMDEVGSLNVRELGYREELSLRLQALLKLPEHGEVKIKLTLEDSGKVLKVVIASFQSEKNRKYIEKTVKTFTFPSFKGNFGNASEYTFSVTLK